MESRKEYVALGMFFLALLLISFASADYTACFIEGDQYRLCNADANINRGCGSADAYTELCVRAYNITNDCYSHGSLPKCNINGAERCSNQNGTAGPQIESNAPNLTLIGPIADSIYSERYVYVIFNVSEPADVSYYDNINGRGQWTRVCSDCTLYNHERAFKEGLNNITFKAVDSSGQENLTEVSFFIDSKKPKVAKYLPKKGFTNGEFYVEIHEMNPIELNISYGILGNYKTQSVNLSECVPIKGNSEKLACDVSVNLSNFSGQVITYWFSLKDIAGTVAESKRPQLTVDIIPPTINNPSSYWTKVGKYVYFNISVNETNFDEIVYRDNSASRPNWRTLCSSLKNGFCVKKITLSQEMGTVDLQLVDDAGNAVGIPVTFSTII